MSRDKSSRRKLVKPNMKIEDRHVDYLMAQAYRGHERCESASQLLRRIIERYMEENPVDH